jgi:predicted transcriptional regulator
LEISIETELDIEDVKEILKKFESANLVRQKAGYYGITIKGIRTMRDIRKMS